MRQRLLAFTVFGVILIAFGEWGLRKGKFENLDQFWLQFCVGNSGDKITHPAVTVVRIDEGYEPLSIGGDDQSSRDGVLSRLDYATILAFTSKFNPRSVAFLPTPSFDENLTLNKTDIAPLKDAAMKLPKLIVASTVSNDGEQAKEAVSLDYPTIKVEGDARAILTFSRTVRYPDAQILANGIPAPKAIESNRDLTSGPDLRVPMVLRRGESFIPSLVLTAVANYAGVSLDDVTLTLGRWRPRLSIGEAYTIPLEPDGSLLVPSRAGLSASMRSNSRDAEGKSKKTLHLASLTVDELAYTGEENDEVAKRILADLQPEFESLRNNLVLIGFDRTADRRLKTATGEILSETSLIARAIATIQSGRYIHWWPNWSRWLAVATIFVLASFLFRLPRRKFLPVTLITALVFFTIKVFIFSTTLAWTPPFAVFSLFVLMLLIGLLIPVRSDSKTGSDSSENFDISGS